MADLKQMKKIFTRANDKFLSRDIKLIEDDVAERSLCGALKSHIEKELENTEYKDYYVDNEYNRNCGKVKTTINGKQKVIKIQCDLLIHSRGENESQDNLIAIEMKKEYQSDEEKDADRDRLCALTKSKHNNETYSYDGKTFPKQVCGYVLGVYYETKSEGILIEYYSNGKKFEEYEKMYKNAGKKK